MPKYTDVPAISGKQLVDLLLKDGWKIHRRATHGVALAKSTAERTLVTIVPDTKASLPEGTLQAILGMKQTRLGKKGLLSLLNTYGT